MRKICCFSFMLLSLSLSAFAQAGSEPMTLVSGQSVEREIAGGQTHTYTIALVAGQFLHVTVEHKNIGLAVTFIGSDEKPVTDATIIATGAMKSLSVETATAVIFRLVVRATDATGVRGMYQVQIQTNTPATSMDRQRIRAERFFAEATRPNSPEASNAKLALEKLGQSLLLWRALGDQYWEAATLSLMGSAFRTNGEPEKAREYLEQVLAIRRAIKDQTGEAVTLSNLGSLYHSSQPGKALEYYEQSLALARASQQRLREATALLNVGNIQQRQARHEKALDAYGQALSIYRELKDRRMEARILMLHAEVYGNQSQFDRAREYAEQTLALAQVIKDEERETGARWMLGMMFAELGHYEKAQEYLEQTLASNRKSNRRLDEGIGLISLVPVYEAVGSYEKAQLYAEQAQAIFRDKKDRLYEAIATAHQGRALYALGQYEQARTSCEQALAILREQKVKDGEASTLSDLGLIYDKMGRIEQARTAYMEALMISRAAKARNIQGEALRNLMRHWSDSSNPNLAIFFGKQSVNTFQETRSDLRRFEKETQQQFLKSKEDTYRKLADLLISQGRLPEAEQVIRMLKEEEYFEYIRRDENNSPKAEKAALTSEEDALDKRYREIADKLTEIGTERGALLEKPSRTPAEEQRLAKLEADLAVAGQAFQKFLDGLAAEMGKNADTNARAFQLRESQGLMEDLRELGKGTVALYTLVGEDKYRVILTTADFQKGYEYPIKAEELNRKVLAFRDVLQNPKLDPLPLAQELYKILVGPVAKDLQGTKAQMVMWSLDGVLRYLPVAALHDGKQYLVERFRTAVFTPASQSRLRVEPSRKWTALGLGVTKSHGPTIPALPGVREEMHGIIQETGAKTGVLPGSIKLDEAFTQEAMLAELRKRNPVVHIASHFKFQPGNETNSALLLGDGQFLSLAQIKSLPNVFAGVDLLTLSACNTATGGAANGKEVEGFGVLAQRQGAKAVVASLWPVADRSTKNLMQEFYKLREAKADVTKVEALRQAQIKLLRGELQVTGEALAAREIVHEAPKATNQPRFKADPKVPYAHPYYWAPFILIGNWK